MKVISILASLSINLDNWILRYIKRLLLGKEPFLVVQKKVLTRWYGNPNAGFFVADIPKINNHSIVYSVGVGEDISFEKDLMKQFDCSISIFDPTPKSWQFVESQKLNPKLKYYNWGLSSFDGPQRFYLPKDENMISGSLVQAKHLNSEPIFLQMKTLMSTMKHLGDNHIDLLKLDIEGSEYEIIEEIIEQRLDVKQIAVEFHHFFDTIPTNKTRKAVKLLNQNGYRIVAISRSRHEITFIK